MAISRQRKKQLIPAAQYLRMSTEDQRFSIENQKEGISEYATKNGFTVVATYTDSGKSGLQLKRRKGLQRLLEDVIRGEAPYDAVLVYDVSRWGRFQDVDESAHYEFLCRRSGKAIHYCAEPFVNDGALSSGVIKALKRAMAGEYSRELAVKVRQGKRRLVQLGYRVGGSAGFGLRRMMISEDGQLKRVLQKYEYKYLHTDRIILVPGPEKEVRWLRKIYAMALDHVQPAAIARQFNKRGIMVEGRQWNTRKVVRVLTNPKYYGCNVWNATSGPLGQTQARVPRDKWILRENAFTALISKKTFDKVQLWMARRTESLPNEYLLKKLKERLARTGRLSAEIINSDPEMPNTYTYWDHFGSLRNAYQLIGYECDPLILKRVDHGIATMKLIEELARTMTRLFPSKLTIFQDAWKKKTLLLLDPGLAVAVVACRRYVTRTRQTRWLFQAMQSERQCLLLVCLFNEKNDGFESFYLLPRTDDSIRVTKWLAPNDPVLQCGIRIRKMSEFYDAARRMAKTNGMSRHKSAA
jgi:DNA invertase Pin-like site-specific DNA recombinase